MFEITEHTADLGLRVEAPDLASLLAEAGRGLTAIITGDLEQVRPATARAMRVEGTDPAYLLFDWLNEVLFAFESERVLLREFDVRVDERGLSATARGERFDPARHRLQHEVKAITYHGLQAVKTGGGWRAQVIVDI